MPKKADILIFKNLSEKQLEVLINQLSYIKQYDQLVDYIFDAKSYSFNGIRPCDTVLIDIDSFWYSTIKNNAIANNLVVDNKLQAIYRKPIFANENQHEVEVFDGNQHHVCEIYGSAIHKMKII